MAKGSGEQHVKKHVIVAGADGKLYKLDRESGSLAPLDRSDPIRRHARRLLRQGVVTADVKPPEEPPDGNGISYTYHLINLASFKDPDADDE